ncbi:MAG: TonB-dependent receptor [Calditrichia bacterium]
MRLFVSIGLLLLFAGLSLGQPATLSGFVADSSSGEMLIGANIYFPELNIGASSNNQGYYAIHPIPPGKYTLVVSYIGFKTIARQLAFTAGEEKVLSFSLAPGALKGEAVEVVDEMQAREKDIKISQVELSARAVRSMPQFAEADLFRTIQALPGVVAQSDFSTGLVVRGGNTDQNLIMLDGITVYNPSHMGGLFSNFLLDAVKDAQFIKGGFPAEFGGRLSSVLNVISKSGNRKNASGSAGISLLSSRASVEVPVREGALLMAGRRTYFDKLLSLMKKEFPYYFYDFQGSFYQDIGKADRIAVSGYWGNDVLDWSALNFNMKWGNRTVAGNWRHVFNPRLFSNFMVAGSRFNTNVQLGGDQGVDSRNNVSDYSFKGDLSYFFNEHILFKFGFEAKKISFSYKDTYDQQNLFSLKQKAVESAVYLQQEWRLSDRWQIKQGIRLNYFNQIRGKFYPEPRFAVKYRLKEGQSLSFSTGLYHQFIHTVQDEFNPTLINNWFAIDETVPVARSIHLIAGYERRLWGTTYIQVEGYYKTLDNMLVYKEQRAAVDEKIGDEVKAAELFDAADGWSTGLELFLHKKYGRLNGWLGYTLNWARKNFDGKSYYASFDQRHSFKLMANYELGKKWQLGVRFNYGSGFPYTRVLGSYEERDGGVVKRRLIYGDRNAFRYPAYHRLDISLTRDFNWLGLPMQFDLQVVNLYKRENVFLYEWDFDENPAKRTTVPMLPLLPTIGISTRF